MRRTTRLMVAMALVVGLVAPTAAGAGEVDGETRAVPSQRRIEGVLPSTADVGALGAIDFDLPDEVCQRSIGSGNYRRQAGRIYALTADGYTLVGVRAYRTRTQARRAAAAFPTAYIDNCDGARGTDGSRWQVVRANVPLRGFGNLRGGVKITPRLNGRATSVALAGAYQVGRYVVIYESNQPRAQGGGLNGFRAQTRRMLRALRADIGGLPGA